MKTIAAGTSPFEPLYGFSRAHRIGNHIWVSGTAPIEADGSSTPGRAEEQAARCFAIILGALQELGAGAEHVVRTRMYITKPADADAVGRQHALIFGKVRPAATMVVVAALLRDEWRVEIEAEAFIAP
jgi:enamine deaminase RidA (YjgF/YER057c/UK114 family)